MNILEEADELVNLLDVDVPGVVLAVDGGGDVPFRDVRESPADQRIDLAGNATELAFDALIKLNACVVAGPVRELLVDVLLVVAPCERIVVSHNVHATPVVRGADVANRLLRSQTKAVARATKLSPASDPTDETPVKIRKYGYNRTDPSAFACENNDSRPGARAGSMWPAARARRRAGSPSRRCISRAYRASVNPAVVWPSWLMT